MEKRFLLTGTGALLSLLVVTFFLTSKVEHIPYNREEEPIFDLGTSPTESEPVADQESFDWESLTREELEKLLHQSGERRTAEGFEFEFEVAPGETIIADSFEGKPGEFVFTSLTPNLIDPNHPDSGFLVKVEMVGVDLSGEESNLMFSKQSNLIEIAPRSIRSQMTVREEGTYRLHLIPSLASDGKSIRMRASGSFQQEAPGNANR